MNFSQIIKENRKRLKLTLAQAAALLDVSPRVYWDWEHGKTKPYAITQEGAIARLVKMK